MPQPEGLKIDWEAKEDLDHNIEVDRLGELHERRQPGGPILPIPIASCPPPLLALRCPLLLLLLLKEGGTAEGADKGVRSTLLQHGSEA